MTKQYRRFLTLPPNASIFLFGPRGSGKSTWLKSHLPNALYIDLLEPETARSLSAHPETLESRVQGASNNLVVIDEIQKLPNLLEVVHRLIENNRDLHFVLTGSSARKLKRAGVDLLAGRALVRFCYPFIAAELGKSFSLERALQVGTMPVVCTHDKPEDVLKSYLYTYVEQEVRQEGVVQNIGNFNRFLEALSFSHASLLNTSDISREAEVPRKTVEGYISIVEDLLLGHRIPVFSRRAKRHLIKKQKFYYIDPGVFAGLRPKGPLDSVQEIAGAALEGLVFQHLKAWIEYFDVKLSISYWRTRSGKEVDFVLYGQDGFYALEVKNSRRVHKKDVSSLKTFSEDYPEATPLLLYRGDARLQIEGIRCEPVEPFLTSLDSKQFPL
ncbi:MAG: ATP-binding protein [Deltaproteobacteria bacterium]|nr:ATP-binding protein [Deltaproteobacteria bacterium]MBN2672349.1 ATP-binding protein [Deltaproteobacteria bacterium]